MISRIIKIKGLLSLILVTAFCMSTMGAVVSDNDGSAFITKAEFDSLKHDFQAQIDRYNSSIDNKIDGAIAGYLAGIRIVREEQLHLATEAIKDIKFFNYPNFVAQGLLSNNGVQSNSIVIGGRGSHDNFYMPSGFWGQSKFSYIPVGSAKYERTEGSNYGSTFTIKLDYWNDYSPTWPYGYTQWATFVMSPFHPAFSHWRTGNTDWSSLPLDMFKMIYGMTNRVGDISNVLTWRRPGILTMYYGWSGVIKVMPYSYFFCLYSGYSYSAKPNRSMAIFDSVDASKPLTPNIFYISGSRTVPDSIERWSTLSYAEVSFEMATNCTLSQYEIVRVGNVWSPIAYFSALGTTYSSSVGSTRIYANNSSRTVNGTVNDPREAANIMYGKSLGNYWIHTFGAGLEGEKFEVPVADYQFSVSIDNLELDWNNGPTFTFSNRWSSAYTRGTSKSITGYDGMTSLNRWSKQQFKWPNFRSVIQLSDAKNYKMALVGYDLKLYQGVPLFDAYFNGCAALSVRASFYKLSTYLLSSPGTYDKVSPNLANFPESVLGNVVLHIHEGPFENVSGNGNTLRLCNDSGDEIASYAQHIEPDANGIFKFNINVKEGQTYYARLEMVNSDDWGVDYAQITDFSGKIRGSE